MKLNEKGLALAEVWQKKWDEAVERDSVANGGEGECGWCVVYDYGMVKTVEDNIGIMLAAYDDGAIEQEMCYMTDSFTSHFSGRPWVHDAGRDVTCREYMMAMCEYFDLSSDDWNMITRFFTSKVKARRHGKE